MKSYYILLFFSLFITVSNAQEKFITKKGSASFFSHSPLEDITADNDQVLSIVDSSTGNIAISMLMKSFAFEKLLMQEHFNENYVESDKFPKAIFKGKIENFSDLDSSKQEVIVKGILTIHGVSKNIETKAQLHKQENNITLDGDFPVAVADFDIKIPGIVRNNIAKIVKVTFALDHEPYK